MVKPHGKNLRKGRWSERGQHYFLTTTVAGRRKIFTQKRHATTVLDALRWLDASGRFVVEAAVVMPDHMHLAGELRLGTLAEVMHSLKS